MADPKGFLTHERETPSYRDKSERVGDYKDVYKEFSTDKVITQASRCMDCGVPFCHKGCPLGNIIPEFNDAVYLKNWEEATKILLSTNNFPEFTGRICPAPCEKACVLGINNPPVTIELIEKTISDIAYEKGYIRAKPPAVRTGKHVAVVGSGPAGLAAAAQLNYAGHSVFVYERDDRVGGLLRYGIPDFKLEKNIVERRVKLMESEGVTFYTNTEVGVDITSEEILKKYDAIVLAGGSTIPRDIEIPGRDADGVHFAMEFLKQNNKRVAGDTNLGKEILATDKNVVVIGGGDTGADCVGTSNRHGAKSITQLELMPKPPEHRDPSTPWPDWPLELRTSSSHLEGCEREWSVLTKEFVKNNKGELTGLEVVSIEWYMDETGRRTFREIEGTEETIPADLALIAAGFLHPQKKGLLENLGVDLTSRGNVADNDYQTSVDKVFVAGDMRRGQSLVVWALSEGREAARKVDEYLQGGESLLEGKTKSVLTFNE